MSHFRTDLRKSCLSLLALGVGAASLGLTVAAGPANAASAGFGQRLFDRCVVCHTTDEYGRHSLGPNLRGIVGRVAGTAEGYVYSEAMVNSGITWTEANITRYLQDADSFSAESFIPGSQMMQPTPPTDDQIEAMLVYMRTLR